MKRQFLLSIVLGLGTGFSVTAGSAETADIIKYRQANMSAVGGHMGAIAAIVRNKAGQTEHLVPHAIAMEQTSTTTADLFPEGSGEGETETLPAVWQQPDEFQQAVEQFTAAASAFRTAAESGDMAQVGPALKELGGSCKNCHDNFRKEK